MNNVIKNFLMVTAVAVPIGTVVGTTVSAVNLPSPKPIPLSTGPTVVVPSTNPFTSPTPYNPFGPTPPGAGGANGSNSNSSAVIVDIQTQPSICDPGEADVFATTDLATAVTNYRLSIGKPVTQNASLNALAQTDTITFINEVVPNTTITVNGVSRTITQRVMTAMPGSKAAAEIVVKGCFPTGNTPQQILALILTNPPNSTSTAIMNNPNWTVFGVNVQSSLNTVFGGGVVYVIIFAQQ
jgi:hypothetical protein